MFESIEDIRIKLRVFLQDTAAFTNVVCRMYIFTDEMQKEDNLADIKNEEQLKKIFLFIAFLFINMGEQLDLFERKASDKTITMMLPVVKDLIAIRNALSHKLYLIEPTEYKIIFKSLQKDLVSADFSPRHAEPSNFSKVRLSSCKHYLEKHLKRVLDKSTRQELFFHWCEMYQLTYQDAILTKTFPFELHELSLALMNSSVMVDQFAQYSHLTVFSLIIILGQLSLRISQHLYPRNIQSARASRSSMDPLEQLLFDLQVIRNQLVHDIITQPHAILNGRALSTIVCAYLIEIKIKLGQEHTPKEVFSASSSYRFLARPARIGEIKVTIPEENPEGFEANIQRIDKKRSKAKRRNALFTLEFFEPEQQSQLTAKTKFTANQTISIVA